MAVSVTLAGKGWIVVMTELTAIQLFLEAKDN